MDNAALVLTFQWQAQLSQNSSFVVTYSFQLKLHIYIKKGYFNKLQSKVSWWWKFLGNRIRIKSLLSRSKNIGLDSDKLYWNIFKILMSTNVCQRDVFINSYKLTKIIKWKKVINTEITSGHFGRKKKRARSQSTSVNYYIRFLKTDKVRPNKK